MQLNHKKVSYVTIHSIFLMILIFIPTVCFLLPFVDLYKSDKSTQKL